MSDCGVFTVSDYFRVPFPSSLHFVPSTVIGWQSDREDGGQISATVDAIDKEVDISAVYQGLPYTCRAALKSVVSLA